MFIAVFFCLTDHVRSLSSLRLKEVGARATIQLGDMRFTAERVVSYLSEQMTLRIGDLVYLGAPAEFEVKAGDNYRLDIGGHKLLDFDIK